MVPTSVVAADIRGEAADRTSAEAAVTSAEVGDHTSVAAVIPAAEDTLVVEAVTAAVITDRSVVAFQKIKRQVFTLPLFAFTI